MLANQPREFLRQQLAAFAGFIDMHGGRNRLSEGRAISQSG